MADDELTRKDAEMGRLTREQIEAWRKICLSHWIAADSGDYLSHEESIRQSNALCDLALQALSLESVREEERAKAKVAVHYARVDALEEAAKSAEQDSLKDWVGGSTGSAVGTAMNIAAAIRALQHAPARVAEEKDVHSTELRK